MLKLFTAFSFLLLSTNLYPQKTNNAYNFKINDKYEINTKINSESIQIFASDTQKISTEQKFQYNIKFTKIYPGNFDFTLKFKKITTEVNQYGQKLVFSSDSSGNTVSEAYKNFTNKDFKFNISKKGTVKRKYNLDSIFKNDENSKQIFIQTAGQKINDILPFGIIFTEKNKKKYTVNDSIKSGILISKNITFNIDSVTGKNIYITENAEIFSDKDSLISMNNVYTSFDIKGKSETKYVFDKKSNIAVKKNIHSRSSGKVYMKYTENSPPANSWQINLKSTAEILCKKE